MLFPRSTVFWLSTKCVILHKCKIDVNGLGCIFLVGTLKIYIGKNNKTIYFLATNISNIDLSPIIC